MSAPQRIHQSWSEKDTADYLSIQDYPSSGTSQEKNDWRQDVYYPEFRKLSLAIGRHMAWLMESGNLPIPQAAEAINTGLLYALKKLRDHPYDETVQVDAGSVFARQLEYFGKINPNTKAPSVHDGIIEFIENGDIQRLDLGPELCTQTGLKVCYKMAGWQIEPVTIKYQTTDVWAPKIVMVPIDITALPTPKTYTTTIPVPSGVLLVADWFRIDEFSELTAPLDDDGGEDLIQSVHGRASISMKYATQMGIGHIFCSRGHVVQSMGAITCGRLQQDELGEYITPAGSVSRLNGPLRWATIVDREHLIGLLARKMSPEDAQKKVDDYVKENDDVIRLTVSPGRHHLYFSGDGQTFADTIANDFQSEGLFLEDFDAPAFALTQHPLQPTLAVSRKPARPGP